MEEQNDAPCPTPRFGFTSWAALHSALRTAHNRVMKGKLGVCPAAVFLGVSVDESVSAPTGENQHPQFLIKLLHMILF